MARFFKSLFGQVIFALILGILVGVFWPQFAVSLKPLGDGFIKLIKMIIAPLVFCVVVHGIVGAGDLKKVGRVGLKSLIYFEAVTTIALVLGIILAYTFSPGKGMNVDVSSLDATALTTYTANAEQVTDTVGFLMKIIPTTVFNAFTTGDILQVLLISILFGAGLALMGEKGRSVGNMIEEVGAVLFKIIGFIVRLAPLGVLGAVSFTVGRYGIASLQQLGFLVLLFYAGVFFFVFVVLGAILRMAGFSIISLIKYFREELAVVTGTASSDSVLPQVMRKLEGLGIKDSTVGLVIPTGYSFNLDAFSLYLTLVVVFIAQATNTDLSFGHMLLILGVALLTSKGAHGIPGSAIVVLAATLSAIPDIPMIGLVLVLSVDWFVGIVRALGNLIGNCVATVVIATWEGDIDKEKADRVLAGERDFDTSVVLTEPASTVAVKVNS
ncbi:C4-dicarboxylate transporter DctA [Brucella intermedia]|uniref:C4-dicarboxylate transport protein n=2 Tax=Brucella intermedia TaxID=94625 RepID=C4WNV3_9HYPH|nr:MULTISPECIES: C4-dicarboxylate transporter DctA [Brucella/Ochrobactrum group]PJT20530.1 C4-dicarboxylate transporter DctA [Ochrobactrum sp. 30A/1000/2015]PJT36669.1 C4-dicarboxylate transporter DctA [Ochrobactrum sp. 27A/999/2015]PJT41356.1 C4-dicarboxylate transporter DctA [Ochrobactrum sp. 23A/997/2015]EEQ94030.1 C4-dicarboxylate transport protein [Brucella intermedia LMG 3301]ELT50715.1 C4-dicarboxylate transporter DctA [Brucella intermedia M86]